MVREPRTRRLLSAVAIFLTALALQRACTLPWGSGASGDLRYRLSVVGLTRESGAGDRATLDCRWWPRYGDAALCAVRPDATTAGQRLRLAYPLLQVGLWLAVASLLLQALRVPRSPLLQGALPAAVAAGSMSAVIFTRQGATRALSALASVPVQFGEMGYWAALAAAVLAATSAVLLISAPLGAKEP